MLRQLHVAVSVAFLLLLGGSISSAHSADRFALVVGNQAYQKAGAQLRNPRNDAVAISSSLRKLGFQVTTVVDLDQERLEESILTFTRQLTPGSAALFYFAGHGLEINGTNYLVPVDAKLREDFEVKRQCLEVSYVLDALEASASNLRVCILDCCRDNPFKRGWQVNASRSRSLINKSSRGMAKMDAPEGTIIAFSTAPGATAADGRANNSPYSQQLVRVLDSRPQGGLLLLSALRSASRSVKQSTGQTPWLNMDATVDEFYLVQANSNPLPRVAENRPAPVTQPKPPNTRSSPGKTTRFNISNTSKIRDAILTLKVGGVMHQISPGGDADFNSPGTSMRFEYFDGTKWVPHTIGANQYPAAEFEVQNQNGKNTWAPRKPNA